jgi:hypothetical protein
MAFKFKFLTLLGLCFVCGPIIASSIQPFNAIYHGYRNNHKIGHAEQSLIRLDNGRYQLDYSSYASLFFLYDKRHETSEFSISNGQIVPYSYQYHRSGTGKNKALSLHFDPQSKQIFIDEKPPIQWTGQLDNQLYRYAFQRNLNLPEQKLSYNIINSRGEPKTYRLTLLGNEELDLPYGTLETVKAKIVRDSNKRETYIWFAPKLDHLMVRLQQFKQGKEQADIKLKSFEYLD